MMWHINEIELSNSAPISIYISLLLGSLTAQKKTCIWQSITVSHKFNEMKKEITRVQIVKICQEEMSRALIEYGPYK